MDQKEKESILLSVQEAGVPVLSGKLPNDLSGGRFLSINNEAAGGLKRKELRVTKLLLCGPTNTTILKKVELVFEKKVIRFNRTGSSRSIWSFFFPLKRWPTDHVKFG